MRLEDYYHEYNERNPDSDDLDYSYNELTGWPNAETAASNADANNLFDNPPF